MPRFTVNSDRSLVAHGRVDARGHLVAADPRLLGLQLAAGGQAGGVLVIPQLASLARMARSLGILVSRGVVAADGADDLDLWVNARPDNNDVNLAISGWAVRPAVIATPEVATERARDFAQLEADGAWAVDAGFALTALSPELSLLIGENAGTAVGKPLTRLFRLIENDDGDLPLLLAGIARTSFVGQTAELRDMPHVQLRLSGIPLIGPDGVFAGYEGNYVLVDRALVSARPVEAAVPVDTGFAARLDKALRVPLTRIIGNADEIGEVNHGPLRHTYAGYAHDISAAGRHLLGLVDDLVDLQAVENEEFQIDTEMVDLADIARRAAGLLRVRAADRNVRIDAPQADEVLMGQGEFRRVLQIMVNLLSNAVRYSPPHSSIWLRTETEGDLVAIIVADQGKGIAETDHVRIFEKFERVDTSELGGSGLGLYISRKLARAMGGDLTVDSAPGLGARFVLTLNA